MKSNNLKKKLTLAIISLCVIILVCWTVFFISLYSNTNYINTKYLSQVSSNIIEMVDTTFSNIEYAAISLSTNIEVKKFMVEEDVLSFYEQEQEINQILTESYSPDWPVEDILIYGTMGTYYSLHGKIGNTSSAIIRNELISDSSIQHFTIQLDAKDYITYVKPVYDQTKIIGSIVFLMSTQTLNNYFDSQNLIDSIEISLVADEKIITSNYESLIDMSIENYLLDEKKYEIKQLGFTPFSIIVADNGFFVTNSFFVFWLITITILIVMIAFSVLFFNFINRRFISPMLNVIYNARQIENSNSFTELKATGEEEVDTLVNHVNYMINSVQKSKESIYEMNYNMQEAEIQRQKMIVVFLKKQINAHFILNTINVVKRLNELGKSKSAADICDSLTYILRYANDSGEYVNGLEEMIVLEKYLNIMNIRHNNHFSWEFEVDDRFDDILLPRMLLQPIVENAVLHGLQLNSNAKLFVSASIVSHLVIITIRDNGSGIEEGKLAQLKDKIKNCHAFDWDKVGIEHIALPNIQKRISNIFGDKYGISISSKEGEGTTVVVTLPIVQRD